MPEPIVPQQLPKPYVSKELHYLSLLQQKMDLLQSLMRIETRIEVYQSAFLNGGE